MTLALVCGSRVVADPVAARAAIFHRLLELPGNMTVLHGGASGVDMWADDVAHGFGIPTRVMCADWKQYGRSAGILRNEAMLDLQPSVVLAFWNGRSRGTKHTIEEAKRRGIPVEVIVV